jgi:hypothetical protein
VNPKILKSLEWDISESVANSANSSETAAEDEPRQFGPVPASNDMTKFENMRGEMQMADLNRGASNPANVASGCGQARMSTISEGQGR